MAEQKPAPKIQVDSDWKAEAQRERERLAKKEQGKAASAKGGQSTPAAATGEQGKKGTRGGHELPEANFRSLVGMLASQAIMGLGAMADPQTNRVVIDLEGSRFAIDLLDVLEQTTKGNLTPEEADELRQILAELRSRYVQITNLVAKQMAAQQGAPQAPEVQIPGSGVRAP
ncbi:MAG: DUF1844 domain-containing protein [Phycisphaerales bacterium]|nr:DUF1844 domain-containing protein [Phycisphaerales bacterium]MCI0630989.1 DUF1844 domain-containing protein [Phycisphaerales bacterium]MCI0676767.1 DUF1844 domain-containing protein [Phycisphaerales bacterium]